MVAPTLAFALYPTPYAVDVDKPFSANGPADSFHTHTSPEAELLHQISEAIWLPGRWNAQLLGRVIQPLPGANKDHELWGVAVRIASLALWIITIPFALASVIIAFPLRCIDHQYRPAIGFIDYSNNANAGSKNLQELLLCVEEPLHVRTHNLGFVTSSMSTTADLRSPEERAAEVVDSIIDDLHKPDVIFFQEAFHEDATRILCEGIKREYPYIIHSVAPQISGFNSGSLVASKYPIESVKFQTLNHMLGPEAASPRGITRVRIESNAGPVLLYGVHTQALIGKDRAQARFHQLEEIQQLMQTDAAADPNVLQVLMGDFNTSRVTAWGEDNVGQAEEDVFNRLNDYFEDLYLKDHDPATGVRTQEFPFYLKQDNGRLQEDLPEPSGSWYHGPFADPGLLLSWKMEHDRQANDFPAPQHVDDIEVVAPTWGTPRWRADQRANTARFDYILLPKQAEKLDGRVEIRRVIVPPNAESASSDHLPVDACIWIKQP